MTEPAFWQTRAGREYYERTLPEIARQLARVGDALERVAKALETRPAEPAPERREEERA